jgi:hypothetical protein
MSQPEPLSPARQFTAVEARAGDTKRGRLDAWRAALAGGIGSLVLYSFCVAMLVCLGHPARHGMLSFWDTLPPGFDAGSTRGMALGFPLAFLYGVGGAWLFAAIYNCLSGRGRAEAEVP